MLIEETRQDHVENQILPLVKMKSHKRKASDVLDEQSNLDQTLKNNTTYVVNLEKKYSDGSVFKRLFDLNLDNKLLIFLTLSFGCACGIFFPLFALFFGEILDVLNEPFRSDYRERCDYICMWFLIIAVLSLLTRVIEFYAASALGEATTKKVRTQLYHKILMMDMTWFDNPRNSAGALTTKLQADVSLINQLIGSIMSIMLESMASLITGNLF